MRKDRYRENHYCSQCRSTTSHAVSGGGTSTCSTCGHLLFPKVFIQAPKLIVHQPNPSNAA